MPTTVRINPPSTDERRVRCRVLLHTLRAHADPDHASPDPLAAKLKVSRQYLSAWIRKGYVPLHQAQRLNRLYGDDLAPIDGLCWTEIK